MHIRSLLCCANGDNNFADVVSPGSDAKKGVSDAVVRWSLTASTAHC